MTQGYRFSFLVFCLVTFVKLATSETNEHDTTETTPSQYILSTWTPSDSRTLVEAHSRKNIILARNSLIGCGKACFVTELPFPPREYPYTSYYDNTMFIMEGASCSAPDAALTKSIDLCPDCYDPGNPSKTQWQTMYASYYDLYNNMDDMFGDSYFNPTVDVATGLCGQRWSSSFYQYLSTATTWSKTWTPGITECPVWATTSSSTFITGFNKNITFDFPGFPFTPSSPCCEGCSFTVGSAQVYQWPASKGASFVSTLTNTANVTFVYPSIYIHFETIAATDSCGEVGRTIDSATTIAFDPKDLSTANSYYWDSSLYVGRLPALNYTRFNTDKDLTCMDITTTLYYIPHAPVLTIRTTAGALDFYDIVGYPNYSDPDGMRWTLSPFPATYNPCTPWLSAPQEVLTLDPLWNTCSRAFQAVHDPGSALTPGGPFEPVTTRTTAYNPPTPVASAGAHITPDLPTQTGLTATNPTSRVREDPLAPAPQPSKLPAVATILKTIIVTADSNSAFDIDGHTFKPGGEIVVSEHTISWETDGNALVVDGTTQPLNPSYGIGTQVIYEGGPAATAANHTYSLDAGGSAIVVDGSTEAAGAAASTAGNAVTKTCVPAYIKDGQTLIAGGLPITSSGTVLSLEPGGKSVVIVVSQTQDIDVLWGGSDSVETASDGGTASGGGSFSSIPLRNGDGSSSAVNSPSTTTTVASTKVHNGSHRGVETDIATSLLTVLVMIGFYLAL